MNPQSPPWLVADIGGTHARFAIAEQVEDRPVLREIRTLKTTQFAGPEQAARHYLEGLTTRPARAVLAVAAPISGEDICMTNCAWRFKRAELCAALGLDKLRVLNDFAAAALGVSALEANDFALLYGTPKSDWCGPVSVIGPGTGMGMALLFRDSRRQWQVLETEGGHASFAPQDQAERQIHDWLHARHGRVSIERVLSGPGLSEIYAALRGLPPAKASTGDTTLPPPAKIVAAAVSGGDAMARSALAKFCGMLGSVAGDVALLHGARTLALAGGMVPRFIPFLKASDFRQRFLDKGRFTSYVENTTVLVVTHPAPGLLGAALSAGLAPSGD
ncbi:MAG: glucokinase [Wenzhouxiangella sp.]